jgi:beta-lactamase regulating signal transducer with metallopeptidase domain
MTLTFGEAAMILSRGTELSILSKATIILVLGLSATWVAGRTRASVRHLLLVCTFAALLALPVIVIGAPEVTVEVPTSRADGSTASVIATSTSGTSLPGDRSNGSQRILDGYSWPSWQTIARSVWIGGVMLLLAWLAIDLWRLRRICREGIPSIELRKIVESLSAECGVGRSVDVVVHEDIAVPFTCGMWRPAIVMPSDACEWGEADLRRAIVHELEHVRRSDWLVQLTARAVYACYWFHPLMWSTWRRLCLEAERACDDAVVQRAERTEYAEQLVLLARRMSRDHAQPALSMANRSDLSTRVSAVLDDGQRRGPAGLFAAATVVGIAALVLIGIAPIRAVQAPLSLASNGTTASARQAPPSQTIPQKIETAAQRRVSELDRALFEAAASGDIQEMDRFLNAGADVNAVLRNDGSPLIAAARSGQLAAVGFLLDRGADANMPVHRDGNPLIAAARAGRLEVVALLLDRGANIDQMVPDDENALIQASGNGHLRVVQFLVTRGADVNAQILVERAGEQPTIELRTPLSMARKGKHRAVEEFLLSVGARQ